jgi:hypothetical protein
MVDDLDDILALPFIERLLETVLQKIMKDSFNVIETSMTVFTISIFQYFSPLTSDLDFLIE